MRIEDILIGNNIELEVKINGRTLPLSSVVSYAKNNLILIDSIKANDKYIGFPDNVLVNFLYKNENKVYIWEDVRVTLVKMHEGIYHKVELIGDGKIYNRRGAYRQYLGEKMSVIVNTANGPSSMNIVVKDISESGFSFLSNIELEIGRTVRLKLREINPVISIAGVIVRSGFNDNIKKNLYGCKFTESNQLLLKMITQMQTAALKKMNSYAFKSIT